MAASMKANMTDSSTRAPGQRSGLDADDCPVQPLRHRERREKEHGHRFDLARQVCEERRLLAIDAQKDESDVHGQRDEKPVPEQSHAVAHGVGVRQRFTGRQPVEDIDRRLNAEQQRDGEDRDECGHAGRLDLGARLVHRGLLAIGWLPVYAET